MNEFFDTVRIDPTKVQNVFLFGSRIYGTHLPDSDYDVLVVLKPDERNYLADLEKEISDYRKLQLASQEEEEFSKCEMEGFLVNSRRQYRRLMIECRDLYNVSVYSYEVFMDLLHEHCIWVLFAMFSNTDPNHEHFWKNECCFPFNQYHNDLSVVQSFTLRMPKLRESVLNEIARTWQKAYNRIVKENDLSKGRKLFVYTFRYLNWAIQLANKEQNHRIYDYTVGNDMHYLVMRMAQNQSEYSLQQIHSEYQQLFEKQLGQSLEEFTQLAQHKTTNDGLYSDANSLIHLQSFVRGNIHDLTTYFSVHIKELASNNEQQRFYQLFADGHETKSEHPMVNICNGMILSKRSNDQIKMEAMSLPVPHEVIIPSYEGNIRYGRADYPHESTIHCYRAYKNTHLFLMFWNGEQWRVEEVTENHSSNNGSIDIAETFWIDWRKLGYCEPRDNQYSYIFEYRKNEFSVDLNIRSITQVISDGSDWRELCRSEIIELLDQQQLNWQLCVMFLTKRIFLPLIEKSVPFSYEVMVPEVKSMIQSLIADLIPHELSDSEDPFELRALEFSIEQNNETYSRRFIYYYPMIHRLEHLQWFRRDTLNCYYTNEGQLPSDVHDAVFDLIRFSITYDDVNHQYSIDNRVLTQMSLQHGIDPTEEGNAWLYVHQVMNSTQSRINRTLGHINDVYAMFENSTLSELSRGVQERAAQKGIKNSRKNEYLRGIQAALCSLKKFSPNERHQNTLKLFRQLELKKAKKMLETIPPANEPCL